MAILGCIADDFTGATDLASMLVEGGMRTASNDWRPAQRPRRKTRTRSSSRSSRAAFPPTRPIAQSLAALQWLRAAGCRQYYFKYCSTFDSTRRWQHRSCGRCSDDGPGHRLHHRLSGLSRKTGERFIADTCSSTTCFSTNPECKITR